MANSDDGRADERRRYLKYVALGLLAGTGVAGAWAASRPPDESDPAPDTDVPPATDTPDPVSPPTDDVPELVRQFAPDLYFGALEKWYPTDPRPYIIETEDGPVVDGFTALDAYSGAFRDAGDPPAPTVFYHVTEAADGVDAIQYWHYSVFDQFTVNFHWHDWELLQVFVDRDADSPRLLSASAHSRAVPNNEFLEPDLSGGRRPGILSEVGSHSSASEVNGVIPSFERLSTDTWHSDVTNDLLDITGDIAAPLAYGLPRDEGARLPFVMPELDDERLDRHPSLSVDRDDFIDERVTVGSWHGLPRPPSDLPLREPGIVLAHPESQTAADATYALEPIEPLRDMIDDFVGPQLSFQFTIPGFLENQLAGHITSVGIPWEQERFNDPLADVTDSLHRRRLDGNEPPGLINRVVGRLRQLGSGADGAMGGVTDDAREALAGLIDVSLYGLPVETAVRLSSAHPEATVTRNGVFGYLHVEPGDHLLVINGPGYAPFAVRFDHDGGLVRAGANGDLTTVANEDAGWIRGDGRETNGITHVRVIEEYAGVVYDGRPVEADRFAIAVHRSGRYTVEIIDRDGRLGAFTVRPADFEDGDVVNDRVVSGKAALAATLQDELDDLYELAVTLARQDGAGRAVIDRLSRAREIAISATSAAEEGEAQAADEWLFTIVSILEEILEILADEEQDGYSDAAVAALEPRVRSVIDRANAAIEASLA